METKLLQLELDMDRAKKDIHELRDIIIALSYSINEINEKLTTYIEEKGSESNS